MTVFGNGQKKSVAESELVKSSHSSVRVTSNPINTSSAPPLRNIDPDGIRQILGRLVMYLRKMPDNSRMKVPCLVDVGSTGVGFTVDKTEKYQTKILIKDAINSPLVWTMRIPYQTLLCITVDDTGQTLFGTLCANRGFGMSDYITYENRQNNMRRIHYDGTTYMPSSQTSTLWIPVTDSGRDKLYDNRVMDLSRALKSCNFGDLLLSLANMRLCLK